MTNLQKGQDVWQEKVPRTGTSSAHICQFCQHQTHDEQLTYFWIPRGGKKRILDVYGIKKKKNKNLQRGRAETMSKQCKGSHLPTL